MDSTCLDPVRTRPPGGVFRLVWWPAGLENLQTKAHLSVMEKSIALTVVAAIVVFAGAYAFSVSKSQGKGK